MEDLDTAIEYYGKLFGAQVNKRKPGYANFAMDNPPLKLVLFENPGATGVSIILGLRISNKPMLISPSNGSQQLELQMSRKLLKPVAMHGRTKSGQRTRQEYAGNGIAYWKMLKILVVLRFLRLRRLVFVALMHPFEGDPTCSTATVFQEVVYQRPHS